METIYVQDKVLKLDCNTINKSLCIIYLGGWILGDFMCQTFGFLNLILTSGNIWVMAIVAIERYVFDEHVMQ